MEGAPLVAAGVTTTSLQAMSVNNAAPDTTLHYTRTCTVISKSRGVFVNLLSRLLLVT